MAVRPLVFLPDPRLRQPSARAEQVTPALLRLARDMIDTMYDAEGIGLAAVQIGELVRLIVVDVAQRQGEKDPQIFINPEIIGASDERATCEEGCLSIPDIREEVERPARVRMRYQDVAGAWQQLEAEGIFATCLQHEIDHINGILFIDHLSKLKRSMITRKFVKRARLVADKD